MNSLKQIAYELKRHAPFTALGAFTGTIVMGISIYAGLSLTPHEIFHTLHPAHIFLSSLVTAGLYKSYGGRKVTAAGIGFFGSIAVCSVSDIIFPYLGGIFLGFPMELHVCFIEHPALVVPSALAGILIGISWPRTRCPHAGHVFLSTYASLFYLTTFGVPLGSLSLLPLIFLILFSAVWIPCCTSDIVFPLLFIRKRGVR